MTLFEVDEAANRIREEVDPEANIIFGSTFDETSVGQDAHLGRRHRHRCRGARPGPAGNQPGQQPRRTAPALREATAGGYTQPMLTQNAATADRVHESARRAVARRARPRAGAARRRRRPKARRCAAAPSSRQAGRCRRGPPGPVDPAGGPPVLPRGSAMPQPRPKGRVPSLIERVTGVGRARARRRRSRATARRPTPPASRPAQPRLAPLEPEERPGSSKEDDLLDIPAFLRRQAN